LYQCFEKQLKTPTCFGSFVIHPQGVLNVLHWNYLWYFCVRSWCLAAWFFGHPFSYYSPKNHAAKHRLRTQKHHK